jgi:hypothetical protein
MKKVNALLIVGLISIFSFTGCATNTAKPAQIDRITPEELAKIMPPPVAVVSLDEIVLDTKQGKTPDFIIEKIKTSNSRYELTPTQTLMLNKQGVDVKVLDYIHQSNEQAKQNAVADELNKREKTKRAELDKLRRDQRQYQYDPFYGFPPYGYGYYGSRYGSRFGWGGGFYRPWGYR